jgi:hypothetical protein
MTEFVRERLEASDDPALWDAVLGHVLADLDPTPGTLVEVGRCSHWLRPHQSHWVTRDGQWFAWPTGYGSGQGGMFLMALPLFDWSVVLTWAGDRWLRATNRSARPALRLTIPSRTARHQQATIHTVWMNAREKQTRWYGFRRVASTWVCTADTDIVKKKKKA